MGATGATGVAGSVGQTGAQGTVGTGLVGPAGPEGVAGARGPVGPTGDRGAAGVVASWTQWREITFTDNTSNIRTPDAQQVAEIAEYMRNNPSLRIGIDGHMNPNNRDLSNLRVNTVREALIRSGVPATQIETGAFGTSAVRRDGRVGILVRTGA
jgi:hypothetical protein